MHSSQVLVAVIVLALSFVIIVQVFEKTSASQTGVVNQTNKSTVNDETKLGTEDLNDDEQTVTQEMIANDLHGLSPAEISTYPLNELSSHDLIMIFNSLSITDLEKTLSSVSQVNLREIFAKFSQVEANQILNRLSETKVQEILNITNSSLRR